MCAAPSPPGPPCSRAPARETPAALEHRLQIPVVPVIWVMGDSRRWPFSWVWRRSRLYDHVGQEQHKQGGGSGWSACTGSVNTGPRSSQRWRQLPAHVPGPPDVPRLHPTPPVLRTEAGGGSVAHTAPRHPACPPRVPVPHLGLKWVGFPRRAPHQDPRAWGRGRPRPDKESGLGRDAVPVQRTQWLSVQASPGCTVGSCSQAAPHGGNPNSISSLLTPRCREKPQPDCPGSRSI